MAHRLLLDTHILLRWFLEPHKLTKAQLRVMQEAERSFTPMSFSGMSLFEMALLRAENHLAVSADFLFDLEQNPAFEIIPLTAAIAEQAAAYPLLRDPADRLIVATARVRRLKLVTSDARIISSGLVDTIH